MLTSVVRRVSLIVAFITVSSCSVVWQLFKSYDKNELTRRFFILGLIWVFNFFYTTVPDETLIRMLKITFLWRIISTITVLIVISVGIRSVKSLSVIANIFDVTSPMSFTASIDHVAYAFNIGLVGVYDFGTMSPYTMVDNAVVVFTIVFTFCAYLRSIIIQILYRALTTCVKVEISMTQHYFLFAILPLSTEFFYCNRLYVIYIYLNTLLGAKASLAILTLTMCKLLQSEFRSVKNVYIIGVLCFLGFSLTYTISLLSGNRMQGVIYGLNVIVLYLGSFKVAVVMWIYGVQRFSTDIHFWLGFKPTKFWRICWSFMPIILFISSVLRIYWLTQMRDLVMTIYAIAWISLSFLIVLIIHIRTVSRYLVRNSLATLLSSSVKYGPPDPEDRQKRRNFNELLRLRRCLHQCSIVDDIIDCNHLPLTSKNKNGSITNIFEAGPSKHSPSVILDMQDNA